MSSSCYTLYTETIITKHRNCPKCGWCLNMLHSGIIKRDGVPRLKSSSWSKIGGPQDGVILLRLLDSGSMSMIELLTATPAPMTLETFISFQWDPEKHDPHCFHLQFSFLLCNILLRHPRTPKIMAQSMARDRRCFHILCIILLLKIEESCTSAHILRDKYNAVFSTREIFCIGFLRSIKYWSKQMIQEFHHHYMRRMMMTLAHAPRPKGACSAFARCGIGCEVVVTICRHSAADKSALGNIIHIAEKRIPGIQSMILKMRNMNRERLCCSRKDCKKRQKTLNVNLKVCSGCKITYYCSRSCQKRAWLSHKSRCLRFGTMHPL